MAHRFTSSSSRMAAVARAITYVVIAVFTYSFGGYGGADGSQTLSSIEESNMQGYCPCCDPNSDDFMTYKCVSTQDTEYLSGLLGVRRATVERMKREEKKHEARAPRRAGRPAPPVAEEPADRGIEAPVVRISTESRSTDRTAYRTHRFHGFDPNAPAASYIGRVNERNKNGRGTTLVDAPANPYSDPQKISRLIQTALNHATEYSRRRCWLFVRKAIESSGMVPPGTVLSGTTPRDHIHKLEAAHFRNILDSNLKAHPEDAPVGSILIYEKTGQPNAPGDAQIRTEHGYVSDFYWPTAFFHQTTGQSHRVIGVMVKDN